MFPPDLLHEIPGDTITGSHANPEETAALKEMAAELDKSLENLSRRQRMIFTLKHYQGLKTRDIARMMNCSEGSIKKQLHRAVATLVKQLAIHNTDLDGGEKP